MIPERFGGLAEQTGSAARFATLGGVVGPSPPAADRASDLVVADFQDPAAAPWAHHYNSPRCLAHARNSGSSWARS